MQETQVRSLGWEDPLEKEMATHSSTLVWEIPWTEESGGLQFTGCKELGTTECACTHHTWYMPSPVPGVTVTAPIEGCVPQQNRT